MNVVMANISNVLLMIKNMLVVVNVTAYQIT